MAAVELVVTDLDGTFWHTDDHLPIDVLDAVAELERRGMPLLVATGRRLTSTRDPLARFGLAPPAVMLNGALGMDLRTATTFHVAPFSPADALVAYDAFRSVGLSPVVYVDHPRFDVLISESPNTNPAHVRSLGDRAGRCRSTGPGHDELRARVGAEAVLGFGMIGVPFDQAEAAFSALAPHVEVHLDRSIDHDGMASLTAAPRDQSKWDGVVAFCRTHGINSARVLVLADGPNDVELLSHASVRLVPDGSHPSALALADTLIPAAVDGGWSAVLDHLG